MIAIDDDRTVMHENCIAAGMLALQNQATEILASGSLRMRCGNTNRIFDAFDSDLALSSACAWSESIFGCACHYLFFTRPFLDFFLFGFLLGSLGLFLLCSELGP